MKPQRGTRRAARQRQSVAVKDGEELIGHIRHRNTIVGISVAWVIGAAIAVVGQIPMAGAYIQVQVVPAGGRKINVQIIIIIIIFT